MTTPQTLMILGAIVFIVLLVMSLGKKKEDEKVENPDEPAEKGVADSTIAQEVPTTREELDKVIRTIEPQPVQVKKQAKRKLRAVRSRPSRNHYHRTRHGYNEGLDIEDILFYMWLLEDSHLDYSEDFEYEIEGVEGIESVSNVGGQITFIGSDGETVMKASQNDGMFDVSDGDLENMTYSIDPETGEIKVFTNDQVQTMSYSDGAWSEESAEVESVQDEPSIGEVAAGAAYVGAVSHSAATEELVADMDDSMVVETGDDSTESTSSSVDSDTDY